MKGPNSAEAMRDLPRGASGTGGAKAVGT